MAKLTRGWLINRIENPMDFNNSDEAVEAFKIALAGMDSESVAFVKSGYALCYFRPPQEYGLKIGDKLYAAPPAPVAVPVTGWIKCSERVPDAGQEIIVMDVKRNQVQSGIVYVHGRFVDFNEEDYEVHNPSHWMPLPSAPEQEV